MNQCELKIVVKVLIVMCEIFGLFLGGHENPLYICDTEKRTFVCIDSYFRQKTVHARRRLCLSG